MYMHLVDSTTRRGFLHASLAGSALIASGALTSMLAHIAFATQALDQGKAATPLKLLILGGTQFIGPALVEIARRRGHSISVFNRGITEKRKGSLGDGIERLVGDRDPDKGQGISALEGKQWDVCIDDSGYYPRHVKAVAELLAPNVRQYVFVSSISAYARNDKAGQDETAELATLKDPTVEEMGPGGAHYGGLKVLCEHAAERALPNRATIVRPGFIVGPGDPTDRFTYWPWRVQHVGRSGYGNEVLSPGTPNDPVQVIDVRDLAAFLIHIAETNTIGAFNACGPGKPLTMGGLLTESQRVCAPHADAATFTWVSPEFLRTYEGGLDTTIWIPPEGESIGFHQWSNARAVAAGMAFRPIADTIRDTLEWFPKELERRIRVTAELAEEAKAKGEKPPTGDPSKIRVGIPPDVEAKALAAWHGLQDPSADPSR